MRWLINYIRSCFCKHDWELLSEKTVWDGDNPRAKYPMGTKWTYRCKNCGYIKTYRDF